MLAATRSPEPGHALVLEHLGLRPVLDLELRLGEGTGAALAIPLLRAATAILRDMATFGSAGVSGPAADGDPPSGPPGDRPDPRPVPAREPLGASTDG
jgi:nicotinate-nucleotide--dimethylbenzimidazole phosphoribosyltransferase